MHRTLERRRADAYEIEFAAPLAHDDSTGLLRPKLPADLKPKEAAKVHCYLRCYARPPNLDRDLPYVSAWCADLKQKEAAKLPCHVPPPV